MLRVDLDALDANAPLERPQLVDLDLDVADLQQLRRGGIDHFDAPSSDRSRDLERQLRPLLEGDDQIGAERRRAQLPGRPRGR